MAGPLHYPSVSISWHSQPFQDARAGPAGQRSRPAPGVTSCCWPAWGTPGEFSRSPQAQYSLSEQSQGDRPQRVHLLEKACLSSASIAFKDLSSAQLYNTEHVQVSVAPRSQQLGLKLALPCHQLRWNPVLQGSTELYFPFICYENTVSLKEPALAFRLLLT